MNLILDTQILLWAAGAPEKLSCEVTAWLEDPQITPYFSSASIWEIVIKRNLERPDFQVDPHLFRRGLLENGYMELPITSSHALAVAHLPQIHKDPFDRILIAQAEQEGFLLVTSDALVAQYHGPIRKV
ncbi:type II toxin-antitoxin system VapC family toxin [Salicola sp. Rm-C-2C1-2]|uniref:type II toxin-antitoxin system VapC family toxin n=1 Tax=Salicola sp. Rm-C-2C1-2 TaxID=3141321 RepID=UPI0032E46303